MMKTKSSSLGLQYLLLFVPVLFIILAINTRTLQGPYYQAYFSDPSYAYLMNSISIVKGELPGHTDHPGTTVQLLGGLVLKVNSLIGKLKGEKTSITVKVLQNPERYIKKISNVLISVIAIAVFLFGLQVYLETKHLGLAIISQAFPLTFATLLEHLPRLEPELLLIASTYMLAATLVPIATGHVSKATSLPRAFFAGIIMGVGLVTKVTFAPLLLFVLVFPGRKAKLIAVIALVGTVVILTIPIWESIPRVVNWLTGLLTHSGRYGHGEIGLPTLSSLLSNAVNLFKSIPVIFCFIPLLLFSLFAAKMDTTFSGLCWARVVSFLVLISCIAVTIKHYAPNYVMQIIALSGFLVLIIVLTFSWEKKAKSIISILCAILIYNAFGQTKESFLNYHRQHAELSWLQEVSKKYGCRTISYYRSSSPQYALQFGNDYARKIYSDDLAKLYPRHVSYNIWGKAFFDFKGSLTGSRLDDFVQNNDPICLLGTQKLPYNGLPQVEIIAEKGQAKLYHFLGFNDLSLATEIKQVKK